MKNIIIILSIVTFIAGGCMRDKKTNSEKLTFPQSIVGKYINSEETDCNLKLIITKSQEEYFYKLQMDNKVFEGKVDFSTEKDGNYIILKGIPWKDPSTMEDAPSSNEIEAQWDNGEISFQNYGNSMNYYVIINCDAKYIVLVKQATNNEIIEHKEKNIVQQSEQFATLQHDNAGEKNIYFSYWSSVNIAFSISDDKKTGKATIEGKEYVGSIEKNKYDEDVYDFCSNGKRIFMFMFEENEGKNNIAIINQHYEIQGSDTKSIDLGLINQPDNMNLLYSRGPDYIIDSIPLMNDKAYYLEQMGVYKESIYILKKVISKDPDRVVAYLNIADAYWGNNEKEEAKESYKKYIDLMKNQGKNMNKIPQRVYDRINLD